MLMVVNCQRIVFRAFGQIGFLGREKCPQNSDVQIHVQEFSFKKISTKISQHVRQVNVKI